MNHFELASSPRQQCFTQLSYFFHIHFSLPIAYAKIFDHIHLEDLLEYKIFLIKHKDSSRLFCCQSIHFFSDLTIQNIFYHPKKQTFQCFSSTQDVPSFHKLPVFPLIMKILLSFSWQTCQFCTIDSQTSTTLNLSYLQCQLLPRGGTTLFTKATCTWP